MTTVEAILHTLIDQLRSEHAASPHGGRHCVSGCHLTGCRTLMLVDDAERQLEQLRHRGSS